MGVRESLQLFTDFLECTRPLHPIPPSTAWDHEEGCLLGAQGRVYWCRRFVLGIG